MDKFRELRAQLREYRNATQEEHELDEFERYLQHSVERWETRMVITRDSTYPGQPVLQDPRNPILFVDGKPVLQL